MMSAGSLTIITPCTRPGNLPRIAESLPDGCRWVVVYDRPLPKSPRVRAEISLTELELKISDWGNPQRNIGLSLASSELVYFLDDDNVLHPNLLSLAAEHPGKAIVVTQVFKDGRIRLPAAPPLGPGYVDTAQVLLPLELARLAAWGAGYAADGQYFSDIYQQCPERFAIDDRTGAFYNYLRP